MKRTPLILFFLFLTVLLLVGACSKGQKSPEPTAVSTEPAVTEAFAGEQPTEETTLPPETEPPEESFLLTFVGDCTLGCVPEVYYAPMGFIKTVGEDYGYPFRNVLSYFENDEFTLVNLEGPLTTDGIRQQKSYTFLGPPAFVEILTQGSVEGVTIANNHTWDFGEYGYISTKRNLEDAGIPYVDKNKTAVFTTKNGITIGLYGTVYYDLDTQDMLEGVAQLKEQGVDLIVVAPHWGTEGNYYPDETQRTYAQAAIDAGADFVWGSHPHVLQPVEFYNGGVICYSLGNFSFGGNSNPDDYDTVIVQQEIIRDPEGQVHLGQTIFIPACLSSADGYNNYQPTPYSPGTGDYQRVLEKLGQ